MKLITHLTLTIHLLLGVTLIENASSLQPYSLFIEKICDNITYTTVKADRVTMDSFHYLAAGTKYDLFAWASKLPNYKEITEDQLINEACYSRNTSTIVDSIGNIFGFGGQSLGSCFSKGNPSGLYGDFIISMEDNGTFELKQIITLTDSQTFLFSYLWSPQLKARFWRVYTGNWAPLREDIKTAVEYHALYLGFNKDNFIFLNREGCGNKDLPV